jgi:hypothetical protein
MRIELVIDELVLVGFDPRERHRIGDVIESRLAALVTPADVAPLVAHGSGLLPVLAGEFTVAKSASGPIPSAVADGTSHALVASLRGVGARPAAEPPGKGVRS